MRQCIYFQKVKTFFVGLFPSKSTTFEPVKRYQIVFSDPNHMCIFGPDSEKYVRI